MQNVQCMARVGAENRNIVASNVVRTEDRTEGERTYEELPIHVRSSVMLLNHPAPQR